MSHPKEGTLDKSLPGVVLEVEEPLVVSHPLDHARLCEVESQVVVLGGNVLAQGVVHVEAKTSRKMLFFKLT